MLADRARSLIHDDLFSALWATGKMDTAEIAASVSAARGILVTEAQVCRALRRPGEMRA